MRPPILEARQIRKHFPGVQALDGVDVSVCAGEVLAIVGENGAGKSTLMKVLAGLYRPDGGELRLDGVPVVFSGVANAMARGISIIHQELNLAENLDVTANLFLGRERLLGGWLRLLNRRAMATRAGELLARVGLSRTLAHTRVGRLPPGQRQLVEIARALSLSVRVLIMDEPTSSLTRREADRLFEVVDELRRDGVAVVYISHRLGEVNRLADRAVVLRDGRNAGELPRDEINHNALVRLMVGRDLRQFFPRTEGRQVGPARLEVRGLLYPGGSEKPVTFTLHGGEIVGMAGLMGAGRTELAETLFGLRRRRSGKVLLDGRPIEVRRPAAAVDAGLLLVPEDRRRDGLVLEESVRDNLALPNYDRLSRLRVVSRRAESLLARDTIRLMQIRTPGPRQIVALLSGGNQQKVVLGKWLARRPKVLICDEPTRGVDVGAKSEIYALLDRLACEGMAVLMISSDLEEVLGMSDRVLVMQEGRLAGELRRSELTEEAIMHLATGGDLQGTLPKEEGVA
jgi:ribose transport system ATP-binding protein